MGYDVVTDRRRPAQLGAVRAVHESRSLWQNSGRYVVRSVTGRARRRLTGGDRALQWSPVELAPRYDVVVLGDGPTGLFSALALARSAAGLEIAVLGTDRFGVGLPARVRVVPHRFRTDPLVQRLAARSADVYEALTTELVLPARRLPVVAAGSTFGSYRSLLQNAPVGVDVHADADGLAGAHREMEGAALSGGLVEHAVLAIEHDELPWSVAGAAARSGVHIVESAPLQGLDRGDDGWILHTEVGDTVCGCVLDTTPGSDASMLAGVAHGSLWQSQLHLVTEPVAPFLDCHVVVDGVEIGQSSRGEVVISGPPCERPVRGRGMDLAEAARLAHLAARAVPRLAALRVGAWGLRSELVRAAGPPVDGSEVDGIYRATGFGEDWSLAPALGEVAAAMITGGSSPVNVSGWMMKPDEPDEPDESVVVAVGGGVR